MEGCQGRGYGFGCGLEEKALTYDTYRLHRLMFAELFTYALGKGWRREIDGNPGKSLLPPKLARVKGGKIRKRMSLEVFNAIKKEAPEWVKLAMDLALQIGIRRGDICHLKLSDFREGCLFFIPSKKWWKCLLREGFLVR